METTEEIRTWIDTIIRKIDTEGRWTPSQGGVVKDTGVVISEVVSEAVEHENTTELGPVLVANHAWNSLKMDSILSESGMNPSSITA